MAEALSPAAEPLYSGPAVREGGHWGGRLLPVHLPCWWAESTVFFGCAHLLGLNNYPEASVSFRLHQGPTAWGSLGNLGSIWRCPTCISNGSLGSCCLKYSHVERVGRGLCGQGQCVPPWHRVHSWLLRATARAATPFKQHRHLLTPWPWSQPITWLHHDVLQFVRSDVCFQRHKCRNKVSHSRRAPESVWCHLLLSQAVSMVTDADFSQQTLPLRIEAPALLTDSCLCSLPAFCLFSVLDFETPTHLCLF